MSKSYAIPEVRIFIENGVIEEVVSATGVRVVVCNYDVEGVDPNTLKKDFHGNLYFETAFVTEDDDVAVYSRT